MTTIHLVRIKTVIAATGVAAALFAAGCSSMPGNGTYGNVSASDCDTTATGPRYAKRPVNAARKGEPCQTATDELTAVLPFGESQV